MPNPWTPVSGDTADWRIYVGYLVTESPEYITTEDGFALLWSGQPVSGWTPVTPSSDPWSPIIGA